MSNNYSYGIVERISYKEKQVAKLEKSVKKFSKLVPAFGIVGTVLDAIGLCFTPMIMKSMLYTGIFSGLIFVGTSFAITCLACEAKHKKLLKNYEKAKVELDLLKNEQYKLNQKASMLELGKDVVEQKIYTEFNMNAIINNEKTNEYTSL